MIKTILRVSLALILMNGCHTQQHKTLNEVIEKGLQRATDQAILMAKELENIEGALPKTTNPDGSLATSDYQWWCSGFFPGQLWYLYENDPQPELRRFAELYTARLVKAKDLTNTHDLGFMLYCSFGNGYRLTGNMTYRNIMIDGANSLISRYNPAIGLIRSWDFNKDKWQYPVIIDNMMNLEFLTWASRETGKNSYKEIALSHANKTQTHHFRDDYSSYHVVSYDTITALPHTKMTHQGLADESVWSRGQAWGLYGYTMMARESGNPAYLEQAWQIALFLMDHPRMPKDGIPYWDLDCPDIPDTPRDASAAAIMASALIELSQLTEGEFSQRCLKMAEQQIRSLTSPDYLAETGENNHFALMHSTGHLPGNSEVDVPLTYADYYYVEALLRMKKLLQ